MRSKLLIASAAALLLAGCGDKAGEPVSNAPAEAGANASAATAAAAVITADEAKRIAHQRHEGMEAIGKAAKAVGQQLKSGTPDLAVIGASAARIDQLAGEASAWFPAGTGRDSIKTRALPEIWQKPADFSAKLSEFQAAAHAFRAAAQSGQLSEIKARFDSLGDSCKACHDPYRAPEH